MEKVDVPAAPGRLIYAVARIGYDPEVALCDLIDNCIDAAATRVDVTLVPEFHAEEGETDTIAQYILSDDGCGMDRDTLIRAFTLGADRNYPSGSLGKFGLGLKSAGLSLGNRITVISKTPEMADPICAILPMDEVERTGEYKIHLGPVPQEYQEVWSARGEASFNHGTTLILDQLNDNQPAYARFLAYLRRYCAIVYHMFIEADEHPITMRINNEVISPIDPLFLREASEAGSLQDPQAWDGRTPHLLLGEHSLKLTNTANASIALTHLIHPPTFDSEGKRGELRDRYLIEADPYTGRPRHGFYVYRNRRIIVLAERFHGLISSSTQAWSFRGRLMFDENADNILSLDVKKRHCQLPKEARNNLAAIVRTHQQKSIKAWEAAGRRVQEKKGESKEELANQSIAATPIASLGYAPGADLDSNAALQTRRRLLEEVRSDTLRNITDREVSQNTLDDRASDNSVVVFVNGLRGNAMWLPYPAIQHGSAETLVNQLHSWITEAYTAAEDDPRITLILHQMITLLARAELEVRSTAWPDLPQDAADKVLERFRKRASVIGEDLADALATDLAKLKGSRVEPDGE